MGGGKGAIRAAATASGLSMSRAKSVWYGEARRVDADEMEALKRAARGPREELLDMARDAQRMADRIAAIDEEMGGPQVDAWRAIAEQMRRLADGGLK